MAADDGARLRPPSIGEAEALAAPTSGAMTNPRAAREAAAMLAADDAAKVAAAIRGNTWGARDEHGATFAQRLAGRVEARRSGRERPVPTPWRSVNDALGGGLWPGFHVIVGATGAGKSQLAMGASLHAAEAAGVPVLYVALELDAFGLYCRAIATLAWGTVFDGNGSPASPQWSDLYTGRADVPEDAARRLEALPFHWVEPPPFGMAYDAIRPAVDALRAEHAGRGYVGPVMVVVDFLQLVASPENAREDLRERIGRAAYQCRAIARDCNAVVIALSSTARQPPGNSPLVVKRDDDGDLNLAALHELVGLGKESGDVEFSADSVMVLCRELWEGDSPPKGGTRVHLAVAKLRAGVPSWCTLAFGGTTFADASAAARAAAPVDLDVSRRKAKPAKRSAPKPTRDPREAAEGEDQ